MIGNIMITNSGKIDLVISNVQTTFLPRNSLLLLGQPTDEYLIDISVPCNYTPECSYFVTNVGRYKTFINSSLKSYIIQLCESRFGIEIPESLQISDQNDLLKIFTYVYGSDGRTILEKLNRNSESEKYSLQDIINGKIQEGVLVYYAVLMRESFRDALVNAMQEYSKEFGNKPYLERLTGSESADAEASRYGVEEEFIHYLEESDNSSYNIVGKILRIIN